MTEEANIGEVLSVRSGVVDARFPAHLPRVNHLLVTGFMFNDLGAMFTPMIYGFAEREHVLDLWEDASGARMMVNYYRFGGVARDVSDDWLKRCRQVVNRLDRKIDEFETLLTGNEIFISRARGVSVIPWQKLATYGVSVPSAPIVVSAEDNGPIELQLFFTR